MMKWIFSILVIWAVGISGLLNVTGYFGLTSKELLVTLALNNNHDNNEEAHLPQPFSNEKICNFIPNLSRGQKKICKSHEGLGNVLNAALQISTYECGYQFQHDRWNCSLGQYRMNLIKQGFKETAFLHAITSASLVYAVARGCSKNVLERCTCDETHDSLQDKETWLWGGCGDNIRYGLRFTDRFLKINKWGHDGRAIMDKHNSRAGIKVVRKSVQKKCKCHGTSGSCNVKTCWKQMPTFREISETIKRKYYKASKVTLAINSVDGDNFKKSNNKNQQKLIKKKKNSKNNRPGKGNLVFIDKSPIFCSKSDYSPGTVGRICDKNITDNCGVLCCGRGYNTRQITVAKPCMCQFKWCCEVKCDTCNSIQEIHTCK